MADHHANHPLTPAQTARRFGISIKALRLYEQRGLLKPARSHGGRGPGWRVYGPDQIAGLHQIVTLKRLGLSLARIGQVLAGPDALESVLGLQEAALAKDAARIHCALILVQAARAKLKSGQSLSIDDLTNLTKETVMTRLSAKEMNQLLTPFADRSISSEEKEAIRAKVPNRSQIARDVDGLMAEAHTLMQIGDPTSPTAQDLARRWAVFARPFTDGADPDALSRFKSIWTEAMKDPAIAGKLALNREILAFVDQAIAHMKAQAK